MAGPGKVADQAKRRVTRQRRLRTSHTRGHGQESAIGSRRADYQLRGSVTQQQRPARDRTGSSRKQLHYTGGSNKSPSAYKPAMSWAFDHVNAEEQRRLKEPGQAT